MKILLTGATGFLGSHLLQALLKNGYDVIILWRSTSNSWRINHLLSQVKAYNVDSDPLKSVFSDQHIDAVIHTACHYGRNEERIHKIAETNLMFGLRLLDLAILSGTASFLNTDTLLPKYFNAYTLSKKQFVDWLYRENGNIQILNFKIEHMYGPNDDKNKLVPWVIDQLVQGVDEIKLTKGEQLRDFIHISDVVSAYICALKNVAQLPQFNNYDIASGVKITVKNLIEVIKATYEDQHGQCETMLNFGALPYRAGEVMKVEADLTEISKLGWAPHVELNIGLSELIKSLHASNGTCNDE